MFNLQMIRSQLRRLFCYQKSQKRWIMV